MPHLDPRDPAPPRVLLVMPEQWPRALLRAALREVGYDALGAPGLAGALRYRAQASDRGPVRLVLVDQAVLQAEEGLALLITLLRRHENPMTILLARAMSTPRVPEEAVPAPWARVIRRPVSVDAIVAAVRDLLPLPQGLSRPVD
jgi:DNA-binding NtrC family response regulator